jgi:hypothetical protein
VNKASYYHTTRRTIINPDRCRLFQKNLVHNPIKHKKRLIGSKRLAAAPFYINESEESEIGIIKQSITVSLVTSEVFAD